MNDFERVGEFQWFVLRVMTGREKLVSRWLQDRGFATFNPQQKVYRHSNHADRGRRKKHERKFSLLPGYVFIGLSDGTPTWSRVFDLTPVLCVIGFEGSPMPVHRPALEKLVRRYGKREFDAPDHHRHMTSRREYNVGDAVITGDGLIEGKVKAIFGRKCHIFVEILGSERLIEADLDRLVAA